MAIERASEESGSGRTGGATSWSVSGMTCQNCARHVREAAQGVAGVAAAMVDLEAGCLRVRWVPGTAPAPDAVTEAVKRAGFRAEPREDTGTEDAGARSAPGAGWRTNLRLGLPVMLFLMLAEWGLGWMHRPWFPGLAFVLALPVQVVCGARFYRGAWSQLRRGASNMDTLVALGSTAAFVFSVWVMVTGTGGHVFFMESVSILTLISLGHWLEARATARAAGAIRALLDLAPPLARRLDDAGAVSEARASELLPGERVVVLPGDRVPLDAEVIEGASSVDESMLTGEARPVEKSKGSRVFAGTTNLDGRLVARVTASGGETVLASIVAAVERAQNSRAGIQRLADRVSSVFVPVVVVLAALTAAAWGLAPEFMAEVHRVVGRFLWPATLPEGSWAAGVIQATSVLIVACPCAMGLATPAAIMAGANAAALRGFLIRDGVALEKAGRIDVVVFDKTGTLTTGRLKVTAVRDRRPEGERGERLEAMAASLARGSQHPVARAIAALVPEPRAIPRLGALGAPGAGGRIGFPSLGGPSAASPWAEWREWRGQGIAGCRVKGGPVLRLGSLTWLRDCGVAGTETPAEEGERGAMRVGLAVGGQLAGLVELDDTLRPEAAEVVAALERDGCQVYVLSGDGQEATVAMAAKAGVAANRVLADRRPEAKAEAVARLQSEGRRVAFVGDGLNDGPALARADLGIAVSRATDVARETADIVLLRGDLGAAREALGLSRATLRTIRQNLFWAFFYNAAAVPLAMLGFFSPVVCAAAMGLSDLVVVGNALRLSRWRARTRAAR